MFVFARNIVLFGVKKASVAESWRAYATGAGVATLVWNHARSARAVELRVPSDFLSSLLMLCYGVLQLRIVNRIAVAA